MAIQTASTCAARFLASDLEVLLAGGSKQAELKRRVQIEWERDPILNPKLQALSLDRASKGESSIAEPGSSKLLRGAASAEDDEDEDGVASRAAKDEHAQPWAAGAALAKYCQGAPGREDWTGSGERAQAAARVRRVLRYLMVDNLATRGARLELWSMQMPSWATRNGVHFGLFCGALQGSGDEE